MSLDVHNSVFPKAKGNHMTSALATALQFKFIKHLRVGLKIGFSAGKAKVAGDIGNAREEFVTLVIGDAALALFMSLNKAIDDEIVERCMLTGIWVVHCSLDKASAFFLRAIFHTIKANNFASDFCT